ncbi:hypothetical protein AFLA_009741 [Aspergillus flavus NRRL3357]|nr:hypothetical protein AFLA_009741 [Aspergillus flavus NRRL3357]
MNVGPLHPRSSSAGDLQQDQIPRLRSRESNAPCSRQAGTMSLHALAGRGSPPSHYRSPALPSSGQYQR